MFTLEAFSTLVGESAMWHYTEVWGPEAKPPYDPKYRCTAFGRWIVGEYYGHSALSIPPPLSLSIVLP